MKILIIQHFGGLGGGSKSAIDVATLFESLGNEVKIGIYKPDDNFIKLAKECGVEVVDDIPQPIVFNFHNASGFVGKTFLNYLKAQKMNNDWATFLSNCDVDLIILNSCVLSPLVNIVKSCGKKCYLFIRETHRKSVLANMMFCSQVKKVDAIFYLTNFDRKKWDIKDVKSFVVPEIVTPSKSNLVINNAVENKDCLKILFLGGFAYYKGALDLLNAILISSQAAKSLKIQCTVLGDLYTEYDSQSVAFKIAKYKYVNYRNICIKRIRQINSTKNAFVDVVGIASNISKYYKKSDLVVFPVKRVHQARPAYEAGLYKKTIVVPDFENFEENITDHFNGFIYKKNNLKSLSNLLIYLSNNMDIVRECGANNYEIAKAKHSQEYARTIVKSALLSLKDNSDI